MITLQRVRHRKAGFTLVEILIALAIFSVAATGLMALFPIAQFTEKEALSQWQSSLIASSVMEALAPPASAMGTASTFSIAVGVNDGIPILKKFPFPSGTTLRASVLYDASGNPLKTLDERATEHPVTETNGYAVATLTLSSKSSLPGMTVAEVSVGTPASAPIAKRTVRRFVRLLDRPPGHE